MSASNNLVSEQLEITVGNNIHNLGWSELCDLAIVSAMNLLTHGLNTYISSETKLFWCWCGNIINLPIYDRPYSIEENIKRKLLQTTILSKLTKVDFDLNTYNNTFLSNSHIINSYLVFPLLEHILKEKCSEYVKIDGTVIQEFSYPNKNGKNCTKKLGSRVSSINQLLQLYLSKVVHKTNSTYISLLLQHIEKTISNGESSTSIIYDWRNGNLHGTISHQTIGGILLNLIILIELTEMSNKFEENRADAVKLYKIQVSNNPSPILFDFEFYPYVENWANNMR